VIDAICGLFGHGRAVWSFSRSDPGSLHCRDLYGWKLHFARRDVGTKATVTVDHTGCDSLYSTAADASTAYFGGHERWADNPDDCDAAGPGAVSASGMVGLNPATGAISFNPTRARSLGADDMLVTSTGLWIASDNFGGSSMCGGVYGYAGICFLPCSN